MKNIEKINMPFLERENHFLNHPVSKKKLLCTGSSGLVGSACVELFIKKGWEVIGIDNDARAKNLDTHHKHIKLDFSQHKELDMDFTDPRQIFNLFRTYTFDAIIHAGGQASHDWSNDHVLEDFITNAMGTVLLLEATRRSCPNATFIYVSTDKVYGENMIMEDLNEKETRYDHGGGFDESIRLDYAGHRSPFGCSKTSADIYTQEYAHTFGLKTGIFRPGCITGKNHEGAELHGFLAYLAKCIRTGTSYRIFGFKGKQVRDQIHANDLANAFWHFIQNPRAGMVYNIGGGPERSVSVLEAIDLIEKETGQKALYGFYPAREGDRIWDVHDASKFRRDYPEWDYQYSLADIIKDVCNKEL